MDIVEAAGNGPRAATDAGKVALCAGSAVEMDEIGAEFVHFDRPITDFVKSGPGLAEHAADTCREFADEPRGVDMQRHMDAGRLRVDQALRIADGAPACAMEVAGFGFDLHRQVDAGDEHLVEGYGHGERIMQRHTGREQACVGPEIGGDGEIRDVG